MNYYFESINEHYQLNIFNPSFNPLSFSLTNILYFLKLYLESGPAEHTSPIFHNFYPTAIKE